MPLIFRGVAALALVILSLPAAAQDVAAGSQPAAGAELRFEDIQGAWVTTKAIQDGQPVAEPAMLWNFADAHTIVVQKNKKGETARCVLEVDFTKKPAQFSFQPPSAKKLVMHGILKRSGSKLVVALSHPAISKQSPTQFKSKKSSRVVYLEFSRPRLSQAGENPGG